MTTEVIPTFAERVAANEIVKNLKRNGAFDVAQVWEKAIYADSFPNSYSADLVEWSRKLIVAGSSATLWGRNCFARVREIARHGGLLPVVDTDPTPAQGIERPNARTLAARQWLRDIADLIADPDTADSDALETLSRALDALDAATN